MNCSFSHFRVGFTRESGRLPLGNNTRQAEAETRAHLDELQVCEGSYCVVGTVAGRAGGVSQIEEVSGGLMLRGHRRLMD